MKRAGAAVRSFAKRIAKMAAVAATAAAVGLIALTKRAFAVQDALAKMARNLDISAKKLAGFRRAAELTGATAADMDKALGRLSVRIGEVATLNTGEAKEAFKKLGLDAVELQAMGVAKAFVAVADALNKQQNSIARNTLGYLLLGRAGIKLAGVLKLGATGLAEVTDRSEELGEALSAVDAAKIEDANDAVRDMKAAFGGLGARIAARVAPAIERLAQGMEDWAKEGGGAIEEIFQGMRLVATGTGQVLDVFHHLSVAMLGLKVTALEVFNGLNRLFTDFVRNAVTLLNKLPFVNLSAVGLGATLSGLASQERVDAAFADFLRRSARPLPSENIAQLFQDAEDKARAAALGIGSATTALEEFLAAGAPMARGGTIQFRTRRELGIVPGGRAPLAFAGANIELKVQQNQLTTLKSIEQRLIANLTMIGRLP